METMICACRILEVRHGPVHLDTRLLMDGDHGYLMDKLPGMLWIFLTAHISNHTCHDIFCNIFVQNMKNSNTTITITVPLLIYLFWIWRLTIFLVLQVHRRIRKQFHFSNYKGTQKHTFFLIYGKDQLQN